MRERILNSNFQENNPNFQLSELSKEFQHHYCNATSENTLLLKFNCYCKNKANTVFDVAIVDLNSL